MTSFVSRSLRTRLCTRSSSCKRPLVSMSHAYLSIGFRSSACKGSRCSRYRGRR
ncbi:MAG: hypothetical protein DWQ21_10130 [Bacteroidetes bacterium]|nr:MAG: hypothetical protein DWQ21_10130 [Bacteroidota bacterium]REK63953.1 MAG: hypothetical protein DWQ49_02320 [Bacteroidota bacterium]